MGFAKGEKLYKRLELSEELLRKAIDNSTGTFQSITDWIRENTEHKRLSRETVRKYIFEHNLDSYIRQREVKVYVSALSNVVKAIEEGDLSASKWYLQYLLRKEQGNPIIVNNAPKDPININFSGGYLSAGELRQRKNVEVEGTLFE